MTESELIDELLKAIKEGKNPNLQGANNRTYSHARRRIIAYALIEMIEESGFLGGYEILTERGHQVLQAGGFDKWRAANEQRETEAHQAALDSAKGTVDAADSAKKSLIAAWLSSIIAAFAVALTFYQIWKGSESDKEINAVKKRVETIDSLLQARSLNQTPTLDLIKTRKAK